MAHARHFGSYVWQQMFLCFSCRQGFCEQRGRYLPRIAQVVESRRKDTQLSMAARNCSSALVFNHKYILGLKAEVASALRPLRLCVLCAARNP
jgi:hypothetical protein